MLPVSGAAVPNTTGADRYRPRISFSRASLSWPKPGPPRSLSRNSAHRPWSFTCCLSGSTSALILGSRDRTAPGNTRSSGSISSLQNWATQSSFSWKSGSVEKSHTMGPNSRSSQTFEEVREQPVDSVGSFLLGPVPAPFQDVAAPQVRQRLGKARDRVGAPEGRAVAVAADEQARHRDGLAGE